MFVVALTPAAVAIQVGDRRRPTWPSRLEHQEGELRFIPLGVDGVRCRRCWWSSYQCDLVSLDTYEDGLRGLVALGSIRPLRSHRRRQP